MEYKTQRERVIEYLETHDSLTSREAVYYLGIMDLPKRISEMVRDGYPIKKTMEPSPPKYGRKQKDIMHYSIAKEEK